MIKKLTVDNFKSHKHTELELSNLTVLCGANGVGKSSAIHALLLLRESYLNKADFKYIDLKSKAIAVGTAKDALYQYSDSSAVGFEIQTESHKLRYRFEANDADLTKTLMYQAENQPHYADKAVLDAESLFNKTCQFISAGRLGPQTLYGKDDVVVEVDGQMSTIEGRAEHFVHFFSVNKSRQVLDSLLNPHSKANDLDSQVSAWEREISEGVNVIVQDIGQLGYELKYSFNIKGKGKTDEFKASNVGFGLTYVMPVIVAILSAPKGALLLIENPEAHLHPNGQAKLTELICLAAQAGLQIIIETHSDHIINGILVQCKKFEVSGIGISKDNVSLYHFDKDEKEPYSIAQKIAIEDNGRIRYAPKGFFDQFTIDRKFLMGF